MMQYCSLPFAGRMIARAFANSSGVLLSSCSTIGKSDPGEEKRKVKKRARRRKKIAQNASHITLHNPLAYKQEKE
jgi:hypothetical protein